MVRQSQHSIRALPGAGEAEVAVRSTPIVSTEHFRKSDRKGLTSKIRTPFKGKIPAETGPVILTKEVISYLYVQLGSLYDLKPSIKGIVGIRRKAEGSQSPQKCWARSPKSRRIRVFPGNARCEAGRQGNDTHPIDRSGLGEDDQRFDRSAVEKFVEARLTAGQKISRPQCPEVDDGYVTDLTDGYDSDATIVCDTGFGRGSPLHRRCVKMAFEAQGPDDLIQVPKDVVHADKVVGLPLHLFHDFQQAVSTGDYFRACHMILDWHDSESEGVPLRERQWFLDHRCAPPYGDTPSPAYDLVDWANRFDEDGVLNANFTVNMKRVVESAWTTLRLIDNKTLNCFTKAEKKAAFRDVSWNPYVIYSTRMADNEICRFEQEPEFFKKLYDIRLRLGLNGDYGFRSKLDGFVAQGGATSSVPDFVKNFTEEAKKAGGDIASVARKAIDYVWDGIVRLMAFCTDAFNRFSTAVRRFLVNKLVDLMLGTTIEWAPEYQASLSSVVYLVFSLAVLFFSIGASIISSRTIQFLMNSVQKSEFVAQAEMHPAQVVTVLVGGLLSLGKGEKTRLGEKARYICTLMAGGTVLTNLGMACFTLLPTVLQDALTAKFGTEETAVKRDFAGWRAAASALIQFSTVPKVVSSPYYISRIDEMLHKGSELMDRTSSPKFVPIRQSLINAYLKLQSIKMQINLYMESSRKRPEPFSVHIAAGSGMGKSLLMERMVKKAMGLNANDIYPWNPDQEYWSGYLNHKVTAIDEFLVGEENVVTKTASAYLRLVSSAAYKLDMPSLDNVFVGVKGVEFESSVVITMNNTLYNRVNGFSDAALQRRRDVLVEMVVDPKYKHLVGNQNVLDFSKLPREAYANTSWVRARFLKPVYGPDWESSATDWMSFDVMCKEIKEFYEEKKALNEVLTETVDFDITESPEEMINKELRKTCNLPAEPLSISEALVSLFGFSGEGPSKKTFKDIVISSSESAGPMPADKPAGPVPADEVEETKTDSSDVEGQEEPGKFRHAHKCPCGNVTRHRVDRGKETIFYCRCGRTLSCEEDGEPASGPDRVNHPVDGCTAGPHFHSCLWNNCTNKTTCRGSGGAPTAWMCQDCKVRFSAESSVMAQNRYEHNDKDSHRPTYFADRDEWVQAVADKLWLDIGSAWRASSQVFKEQTGSSVKMRLVSCAMMGMAIGIMGSLKSAISEEQAEEVTFSAESDPRKHIRHRKRREDRWNRGEDYRGNAAKPLPTATLDTGEHSVTAIPLAGRWFVTYVHCLMGTGIPPPDGTKMTLHYRDHAYDFEWSLANKVWCTDDNGDFVYDLVFIKVENNKMPEFRNIIGSFISEMELPERDFRISARFLSGLTMSTAKYDSQSYTHRDIEYSLNDGLRYLADTTMGDCGTPIMMAEGKHANKCVGLHVAGSIRKQGVPTGLAVRLTREMIEEAIGEFLPGFSGEAPLIERLTELETPNLLSLEKVSKSATVHLSDKTKLQPSVIAGSLPWTTTREPAILSQKDPRSQGKDPVEEAIVRLVTAPKMELDQDRVDRCVADVSKRLSRVLDWSGTGGPRELSFEEAVFGVPGSLSGLATDTSPGRPYVYFTNKRGKRELVWHNEQGGHVSPSFKKHVMDVYQRVRSGEDYEVIFLGYMKDEVRSKKKIDSVATRITYANDVTYTVITRMMIGAMIAAFNRSFPASCYAIGINQNSYDAQKIYHIFRECPNRIAAGDMENYDYHYQRQLMDGSHLVIENVATYLPAGCVRHICETESLGRVQIADWMIRTVASNNCGKVLTTHLNCINNELNFRYAFDVRFPTKVFDEHVRFVFCGDDNMIGVMKSIEWTPKMIQEDLTYVGQRYTAAEKDQEVADEYQTFSEVTFLGSYFRKLRGRWTGALRKNTLQESILWTRNSNLTVVQECKQMMEYASQWDKEYFESYCAAVNNALTDVGISAIELPSWESLSEIVANRTVDSGEDYFFVAQSPADNLTGFGTDSQAGINRIQPRGVPSSRAITNSDFTIRDGLESFVQRASYDWTNTMNVGTHLKSIAIPGGLLKLGDQDGVQNMSFQNFMYSRCDIEIKIQLNGTPTQAGCLVAYFVPFRSNTQDTSTYLSYNHVKLSPAENTTGVVRIPYTYWRPLISNMEMQLDETVSYGTFFISVYNPLTSKAASTCGVTIFSRFIGEQKIPRVMTTSATRPVYGFVRGTGANLGRVLSSDTQYVAQGANVSKTEVTNTYNISDVAGGMPIENSVGANTSQGLDQKADVRAVPMDNPPLVGGGVPVVQQFGSMSKANGPEVTTGLYLHPQEMSRQPIAARFSEETRLDYLSSLPGRIAIVPWTDQDADGALLWSLPLRSFLLPSPSSTGTGTIVPPCVAFMNRFQFLHFDTVFRFHVVRNKFQSGRLKVMVTYGTSVQPKEETPLYGEVLDFSGENSVVEVVVPYNNNSEYIRTDMNLADVQSQSTGTLWLFVLNELRTTSEVVGGACSVNVEVYFKNVRVAHPSSYSSVEFTDGLSRLRFTAQGPGDIAELDDANEAETQSIMAPTAKVPNPICRVQVGEKFEYNVSDIHEELRRHRPYPASRISPFDLTEKPLFSTMPATPNRVVYRIPTLPASDYDSCYAAWSGSLRFRIYADTSAHCTVTHVQGQVAKFTASGFIDRSEILAANTTAFSGNLGASAGVPNTPTVYYPAIAREVLYPVGSQCFIDVTVPYSSEYDFTPTWVDTFGASGAPTTYGTGFLYVNCPAGTDIRVYWAAGDDFRYHFLSFRRAPSRRVFAQNVTGNSFTIGGIVPPS
ncbi:hypothetical protein [Wenzhou picorna-like virus 25]|uniref:hypothetical protein n=1 Tax=Wenzhou picorna-like virus 25 TaxID=1923610 RepID=UPI00090B3D51|nr:hypothetical protein [Wenzhou picorna-like virus 25]APG78518.1 hypothetical protein [Wenzhou picorna-like virus 25]